MAFNFQWKDEYSVGVFEIDEQHKQLIQAISKLNDALNANSIKQDMAEIVAELETYINEHFSTEEKYFKQFAYEGASKHIEEHRKFATKIAQFNAQYAERKIEVSIELISFLEDWLLDHMFTLDRKYMECFAKNGLK